MVKPKMLITAAAGKTGFATARLLLQRGYPVRAMVRQPGIRASELQMAGAEIFYGSMSDLHDMTAAMEGVQRAYFCPPWHPNMLYFGMVFAVAAQAARLEAAVAMSQWIADPDHPTVDARQSWYLEQVLPWIPGVGVAVVNPGFFADNYMPLLQYIAHLGVLPLPLGQGLNAPPSNEDIAQVIAGILINPASHLGKTYRPTGPRLLSPAEIADSFARVVGRPVRYLDIPEWMLLKAMRVIGMPAFMQTQVRVVMHEYRRNVFAIGAPSSAVLDIADKQPEDFETTVRRYVAQRPEANPGMGNWLRAIINFMRIPLTPAHNLDLLVQTQDHPKGRRMVFAGESERWKKTHHPTASSNSYLDQTELSPSH